MRELIREAIDNARRSGDRVGVDGTLARLGTESIRLARLATAIHLVESARLIAGSVNEADRPSPVREPVT